MQLPPLVIELLTPAAGVQMGDYPREQRHETRYRVGRRGTLAHLVAGEPRSATVMVRDVSATGIGLVHTTAMEVGGLFVLVVPTARAKTAEETVVVQCRVVRCARSGAGGAAYVVGAAFVQLLKATAEPIRRAPPPR